MNSKRGEEKVGKIQWKENNMEQSRKTRKMK